MSQADSLQAFSNFCRQQQKEICAFLESLDRSATFKKNTWSRPGGGGGTMALFKGDIFEKAGVNVSEVHGELSPSFRKKIPGCSDDARFWAAGLSLVIHPQSPYVPIIHMNVRHIKTQKSWFGGGIDLTPTYPCVKETEAFHQGLQKVCKPFGDKLYKAFKKAADDYFWIAHRKEPRGVGGIFYDNLEWAFDKGMAFTESVCKAFIPLYRPLVENNLNRPISKSAREALLKKRGRYVEFNLVYDRGTTFGLQTEGNIEAILMSLPPLASWPPYLSSETVS